MVYISLLCMHTCTRGGATYVNERLLPMTFVRGVVKHCMCMHWGRAEERALHLVRKCVCALSMPGCYGYASTWESYHVVTDLE